MKVKHFIFFSLSLLLMACNSDDNDRTTPELTRYEFFEDAKMIMGISQTSDVFEIEPGNKTVFKYFFKDDDNEDISDDEYAESIYFEIDSDLNSFSYTDTELQDLLLFIRRSCFCASTGFVFTDIGSVSGTKLANGNWDVDISITFQWDEFSETETRNISGQFRLMPIP